MAQHILNAMSAAGLTPTIVARDSRLADLAPVLVEDLSSPQHPLSGVLAALSSLPPEAVAVFAPCDVPDLPAQAFAQLLAVGGPAVAYDGERVHPLIACYPSSWCVQVADALERRASARSVAAEATRVRMPETWLKNVNRRSDLR